MSKEKFNISSNYLTKILKTTFALPNGKPALVFVKNKDRTGLYDCVLCSAHQMSPYNLIQHSRGRRHGTNLSYVDTSSDGSMNDEDIRELNCDTVEQLPKASENSLSRSQNGESTNCGSPRQESARVDDGGGPKVSKLQTTLDEIKDVPIVGLEHILDVQLNGDSTHLCVLCQKMFHPISDVVEHLTSHSHRLLYLQKFFPKVFDDVASLIEMVCDGIEKKYHRSKLLVLEKSEYLKNKEKYIQLPSNEYINEKIGCTDLVPQGSKGAFGGNTAVCDEVISISSDTSSDDTNSTANTVKLATLWTQMVAAKDELLKAYQLYITNPNSYPGYDQMWVTFWNTRITELQHSDKLKTYDWTAEWASEWRKIMNEKLNADLEVKCSRIKKTLGITDSMLGERERNFMSAVANAAKPASSTPAGNRPEKPTSPIDCKPRMRSLSPQKVPLRSSNSSHTSSTADKQKKKKSKSLNKSRTPLGLEQLLEKHNHNDDFMISWRELLDIFGIEGGDNSDDIASVPGKTCQKTAKQETKDPVTVQNDEPVTVISVLRTLVALENMLGSLAPQAIDLLQTAIGMEGLKPDSSSTLLNNSNYCILFETIKEKFKGLLMGELVAANLQENIRSAIDDITSLLQSAERAKIFYVLPTFKETTPQAQTFLSIDGSNNFDLLASLSQSIPKAQPKPQTSVQMESPKNCYVPPSLNQIEKTTSSPQHQTSLLIDSPTHKLDMPSFNQGVDTTPQQREALSPLPIIDGNEVAVLEDSEIKTLMTKFAYLSAKEKNNFVDFLNKLRISDPNRLMRLKNEICANQFNQLSVLEWEKGMNCPGEMAYCGSMDFSEDTFESDEHEKVMSIAYQVAKKNSAVKIKRRNPGESDGFLEGKRFYQG